MTDDPKVHCKKSCKKMQNRHTPTTNTTLALSYLTYIPYLTTTYLLTPCHLNQRDGNEEFQKERCPPGQLPLSGRRLSVLVIEIVDAQNAQGSLR